METGNKPERHKPKNKQINSPNHQLVFNEEEKPVLP